MPKPNVKAEKSPRLAVRAVILHRGRLLLVNAWPDGRSDLLCAPGGGVQSGSALPDNLEREVFEETGLKINVGDPCLINEFHHAASGFHQVEIFFRCMVTANATIDENWEDAEKIVTEHYWLTQDEMMTRRIKPDALARIAFDTTTTLCYDSLEPVLF